MASINANELKEKGVSAIQTVLNEQTEATISIQGKECFVVMNIEHYQYLCECELTAALAETKIEIAEGRYVIESATEHLARLEAKE